MGAAGRKKKMVQEQKIFPIWAAQEWGERSVYSIGPESSNEGDGNLQEN